MRTFDFVVGNIHSQWTLCVSTDVLAVLVILNHSIQRILHSFLALASFCNILPTDFHNHMANYMNGSLPSATTPLKRSAYHSVVTDHLKKPIPHAGTAKEMPSDQKQMQPQPSPSAGEEAGTHPAKTNHWHVPQHPADSLSAKPISVLTSMR